MYLILLQTLVMNTFVGNILIGQILVKITNQYFKKTTPKTS